MSTIEFINCNNKQNNNLEEDQDNDLNNFYNDIDRIVFGTDKDTNNDSIDIYNPLELTEYIKNNFNDKEIDNASDEIDTLYKNFNEIDECTFFINIIISPSILGLGFFENFNLLTAINMITPDLFRKCFVRDPDNFKQTSQYICPTYSKMPLLTPSADIGYEYNNFYQLLIEKDILKGFLYFNFSSNPFDQRLGLISTLFLKYRFLENFPNGEVNNNNFTNVQTIFNKLYSDNSLLVQLLNFNNQLENSVSSFEINNTNYPRVSIPWITSYTCLSISPNPNKFIIYNNVENPLENNELLYADMYYLSTSKVNYKALSEQIGSDINSPQLTETINNNNIYNLLDIALEVYQDILVELNALIYKKQYKQKPYTSYYVLSQCINYYCNYLQNEAFLFTGSSSFNNEADADICNTNISQDLYNIIMNPNYTIDDHNSLKDRIENGDF